METSKSHPKSWRKVKLEDVLELIIDHRGKTPKKLGGDWSLTGIPALSAKNIKDGNIINEKDIRFVDKLLYEKWMPVKLEQGDILLTSEAPLGELYYLKEKKDYCLSQRLFALRINRAKLYPQYLYYFLRSPLGQHQLHRRISGTAAEGIRQAELVQIEIDVPEDISTQRRIAAILSAFDDKIELNNKINHALEQMAQAIFKEWFVEWRIPNVEVRMRKATAEEKAVTGKDEIPEGWGVVRLGDVCEVVYGKDLPTKSLKKAGFAVYGGNGIIGYADEYMYEEPQIIVGCRGAYSGNIFKTEPKSFVTHNSLIIKRKNLGFNYLYYLLKYSNVKSSVTGSAQPQITITELDKLLIELPSKEIINKHESLIAHFYKQMMNLSNENVALSSLRDLFLPRLMSGAIEL